MRRKLVAMEDIIPNVIKRRLPMIRVIISDKGVMSDESILPPRKKNVERCRCHNRILLNSKETVTTIYPYTFISAISLFEFLRRFFMYKFGCDIIQDVNFNYDTFIFITGVIIS